MEQLQSYIWLTASSYMTKYLRISSYMTLQLLHSEFPYIWGKFDFLFFPVTAKIVKVVKYEFVLKNKGAFYRIPKDARPRDLRPDLYVAFVEEDGEEADGEDKGSGPDAQGHRQVHTHLLQEHTNMWSIRPSPESGLMFLHCQSNEENQMYSLFNYQTNEENRVGSLLYNYRRNEENRINLFLNY